MQFIYLDICKEDLQEFINTHDWGQPRGRNNKHYSTLRGTIFDRTDQFGNDIVVNKLQTREQIERGDRAERVFNGKTQEARNAFFDNFKGNSGNQSQQQYTSQQKPEKTSINVGGDDLPF